MVVLEIQKRNEFLFAQLGYIFWGEYRLISGKNSSRVATIFIINLFAGLKSGQDYAQIADSLAVLFFIYHSQGPGVLQDINPSI